MARHHGGVAAISARRLATVELMARYDIDVLDGFDARKRAAAAPTAEASTGLVVEHRRTGYVGSVVTTTADSVTLRDRHGNKRLFSFQPGGFMIEGRTVTLVRPKPVQAKPAEPEATASGSVHVRHEARVARASRLLVEGIHDAALVEKVWGDDLRFEGIVVERLDGIDHLRDAIEAFQPGPGRRLGVLVDHLVPGSKEDRIVSQVASPHVLVTGTPFVDVWQAVRPKVLGIDSWPVIPKGTDWKTGICRAFRVEDPADLWRRLLSSVGSYARPGCATIPPPTHTTLAVARRQRSTRPDRNERH
jgi:Protein of unknown function (DUF3097)